MSRKNKNLRAFLHQNPSPTIEQAWDSAWSGAQKTFHARSMQEMRMQVDRLREALDRLVRSCDNLEYEAGRVALSVSDAEDLLDELDNMENVS